MLMREEVVLAEIDLLGRLIHSVVGYVTPYYITTYILTNPNRLIS
jgi:hypothetical protein